MNPNVLEYIEKKKLVQKLLLHFIDCDINIEENVENFFNFINDQHVANDIYEFRLLISLIMKISNNHYRSKNFFFKIEKILEYFKADIKSKYSNNEIFDLFKSNKRILLFLVKSNILQIDENISNIMKKNKYKIAKYQEYLCLSKEKSIPSDHLIDFEKKQNEGENDLHICKLIREDMIQEFIKYVKETNFPLDALIKTSIFETNNFLLKREPTLLEYCAFFGSIQIFKFLIRSKVPLSDSLWEYAIHGNNLELIDFLKNKKQKPKDATYRSCLEESIKCHHINISNHIISNIINTQDELLNQKNKYNKNIHYYSFHYHNYTFLTKELDHRFLFFYACQFNYYSLVRFYLMNKNVNINEKVISKLIF